MNPMETLINDLNSLNADDVAHFTLKAAHEMALIDFVSNAAIAIAKKRFAVSEKTHCPIAISFCVLSGDLYVQQRLDTIGTSATPSQSIAIATHLAKYVADKILESYLKENGQ